MTRPLGKRRGVALIEALVALAVMALGMLAVVGVQGVLRGNSDVAKQRSEAVRLAQEAIETWRGFAVLEADASTAYLDYTDITIAGAETIGGLNASYSRVRTVTDLIAPQRGKMLRVDVSWPDRTGITQTIQLTSVLAGVAPELALTLVAPAEGSPTLMPLGRNAGIPRQAKDLGNGTSGLMPGGAAPADMVWVFDNATALMQLCTTTAVNTNDLSTANISCVSASRYMLVAGYLRYALGSTQPTAGDATSPPDSSLDLSLPPVAQLPLVIVLNRTLPEPQTAEACYYTSDETTSPPYYTRFMCAVYVGASSNPSWTGKLAVGPSSSIATDAADFSNSHVRVCRYFELADNPATTTVNEGDGIDSDVKKPADNRNFLIIRAGDGSIAPFTCPPGTVQHQP